MPLFAECRLAEQKAVREELVEHQELVELSVQVVHRRPPQTYTTT